MINNETFPYNGRMIYSETENNGNTFYGYITNKSEADRITSKYGSEFVLPTNKPEKFVVVLGGYNKGFINPVRYEPGYDTAKLNGISNLDLQTKIFFDPNFKKMATGGLSPNAAQNPEQASSPSPGSNPNVQNTNDLILNYPSSIISNKQDRIKFTVWEIYKLDPNSINTNNENTFYRISPPENESTDYKRVEDTPTVFLPIQPSITDSNSVDWGEGKINEIERQAAKLALTAMSRGLNAAITESGRLLEAISKNPGDLKTLGQIALTEQAVGVQGLLSRTTGQVLNPNLELLFQGPQLRPFNFTFKLSPRSEEEAVIVKKIIKYFKKNMAVRKDTSSKLFLKAPYVFGIEYLRSNVETDLHPSLNKIKKCALRSCSVDYTPLGSYMTYDDDEHTMVSYTMTLQFQEIVPIYNEDYNGHSIGF